jgi:hypothetical protein
MAQKLVGSSKPGKTNRKGAYDSPWKASVQRLFPQFLEFFFPDLPRSSPIFPDLPRSSWIG